MEIPYLDYAKHEEALIEMGIPKGNVYGNWGDGLEQDFSKMMGWSGF